MKNYSTRQIFTVILLALAIFLPVFNQTHAQRLPLFGGQENRYDPKKDQLVTPTIQDIKSDITLVGQIEADRVADIRFATPGRLAWVGVRVGDWVNKGQAIASLNKTELRQELERELNDYKTALHNFNDTQDEYQEEKDKALITTEIQRILDRAQYTLNNAVIDYELDDLAIKYATITTPVSGIVTNVEQPFTGVNITPATAGFTVVDPQSLYFSAQIDEEDVVKVNPNQSATILLDVQPDSVIDSQISYISLTPIPGQTSTIYEIRFSLPLENDPINYRLGMNGDATLVTQNQNQVLTLPIEAVFFEDDQAYTLVLQDDNLFQKVPVSTGIESDQFIQILDGVNTNDQIVIQSNL